VTIENIFKIQACKCIYKQYAKIKHEGVICFKRDLAVAVGIGFACVRVDERRAPRRRGDTLNAAIASVSRKCLFLRVLF
jgi:hypothetical protein